jgi:hypothetical protein
LLWKQTTDKSPHPMAGEIVGIAGCCARAPIGHATTVVARSIHEGLLQLLLQDAQAPEIYPLYALLPPGRHQPIKVKVFIDFLIERE